MSYNGALINRDMALASAKLFRTLACDMTNEVAACVALRKAEDAEARAFQYGREAEAYAMREEAA